MLVAAVNASLAWVHILAAIGWMGTAMLLIDVLIPFIRSLSPSSRSEVLLKLLPRFIRYVTLFASLTLAAGAVLAFGIAWSNLNLLSPATEWGLRITIGSSLGLAAYVLALGVGVRSARRIVGILSAHQDSEKGAQEMAGLQQRMRVTAATVVVLLALALVFMVAAARL